MPSARHRTLRKIAAWAAMGGIFVLVPKCPLCRAAYVMLCTGVALSPPAAALVRWLLLALAGGTLVVMTAIRLAHIGRASHPVKQETHHAKPNCNAR